MGEAKRRRSVSAAGLSYWRQSVNFDKGNWATITGPPPGHELVAERAVGVVIYLEPRPDLFPPSGWPLEARLSWPEDRRSPGTWLDGGLSFTISEPWKGSEPEAPYTASVVAWRPEVAAGMWSVLHMFLESWETALRDSDMYPEKTARTPAPPPWHASLMHPGALDLSPEKMRHLFGAESNLAMAAIWRGMSPSAMT